MHKMMLDHYQQTKKIPVTYNPNTLGFFWVKAQFPGAARAAPDPSSRHPRSRPPEFTAGSTAPGGSSVFEKTCGTRPSQCKPLRLKPAVLRRRYLLTVGRR
jgi:hypothetical protein